MDVENLLMFLHDGISRKRHIFNQIVSTREISHFSGHFNVHKNNNLSTSVSNKNLYSKVLKIFVNLMHKRN